MSWCRLGLVLCFKVACAACELLVWTPGGNVIITCLGGWEHRRRWEYCSFFLNESLISHACHVQAPRADQTRVWGYGVELSRYNQVATSQSTCICHTSNCKCRSASTNSWCRSVSTRCLCSLFTSCLCRSTPIGYRCRSISTWCRLFSQVVNLLIKKSCAPYFTIPGLFLSISCYSISCFCLRPVIVFRVFVYVIL